MAAFGGKEHALVLENDWNEFPIVQKHILDDYKGIDGRKLIQNEKDDRPNFLPRRPVARHPKTDETGPVAMKLNSPFGA